MNIYKIKLVGIALLLFMTGCNKKNELTLPVRVHFKIGISQDNSLKVEYLTYTFCQIAIESIRFEGKREAGEDFFFETDSKMNLKTLSFLEPIIISDFDIPQGIYNYMKWDIYMKCIGTEGLFDLGDESFPCKGIVISGTYKSLEGRAIPIILAIDEPERISITASHPDDDSSIVLSSDKEYEAVVLFAPDYAFSSISRESLEEADIYGDSEHPVIIISSSKNTDLYENLLYRIFLSTSLTVR